MSKYIRVVISGRYGDETHYAELPGEGPWSQKELQEIGQDTVNEQYSWGIGEEILDESEVPEGDR